MPLSKRCRAEDVDLDLRGLVLPDARSGLPVDLGGLAGPLVLTAMRHRY